jgi:transglutaminase-like putative cysteine protease
VTSPNEHRTSFDRDLAATAAMTLYSLTVAVGFARVFSGWDFLVELGLLVVIGHGVSFVMRRARVSGWIAIPAMIVLLLWVLLALRYGATLDLGLPGSATRAQLDLDVGLVREQFQTAIAPVTYDVGWATLAGFAVVATVVMADAFAFRAEARGEALVPGGVLFVFIAALGSPRLRIVATVLLIAAGIVAVTALRTLHDRSRRVELTSRKAPSLTVPAAIASAAAVALLAGVIGPRIPGAGAEPLYETRGRGGGDTTLISPLVDIRSRLTNRDNVELFRVNADAPSYWRVTTLPEFDGRRFQLPRRSLERVEGSFGSGDGAQIRQQIQVLSLGGQLVPAAPDPFQASGFSGGAELSLNLNRDTSTLLAPDDMQAGDLFTVVSASPALDKDILRSASVSNPPDAIFTELPDDLPDLVEELARSVTADAQTPYDQAFAMQQWFRNQFEYSLEVQAGHGSNAIESFLQQRVGYCEQFAATFAAMARTLGIPSRVAVGFTPGVINDEGWYSVLGKNAHAWPELWFDGIGWVLFEPTPGRGAPGAEGYTEVQPQQDASGQGPVGDEGVGTGDPLPTTPSTVVAPPTTIGDGTTATTVPPLDGEVPQFPDGGGTFGGELTDGAGTTADDGVTIPWRSLLIVIAVFGTLSMPALARRWNRRAARSLDPAQRVSAAWYRAQNAAELAGVGGSPAMTPREWAAATAAHLPVAARPMASLAAIVDQVGFAPPGSIDLEHAGAYGSTLRHDCELWSNQVGRIAGDTMTLPQRVRHYFVDWR